MVGTTLSRLASERHPQVVWPRHEALRGHRGRLSSDAGKGAARMLHNKVHKKVSSADFGSPNSFRLAKQRTLHHIFKRRMVLFLAWFFQQFIEILQNQLNRFQALKLLANFNNLLDFEYDFNRAHISILM